MSRLGITAFLWILGVALIWPVLPFQALALGATPFVVTLLLATDTAVAVVVGPLLGRASDRSGRGPVIIAGLAVGAAGYALLASAETLTALFLARVLGGLSLAALPALQAGFSDATSTENRISGFSTFNGAYATAFVVGPLVTWMSLQGLGASPTAMALAAAATSLLAIGALLFRARPGKGGRAPALGATLQDAAGWRGLLLAPVLLPLAAIVALGTAHSGWDAIVAVWSEQRLAWGEAEVAVGYTVAGACAAVSQFFVVPRACRHKGVVPIAIVATLGAAGALILLALTADGTLALLSLGIFGAAAATANSCLFTRLSQETPAHRQGAALGLATGLLSLAWLIGPVTAGLSFSSTAPGLPFLIGATLCLFATVLLTAGVSALRPLRGRSTARAASER